MPNDGTSGFHEVFSKEIECVRARRQTIAHAAERGAAGFRTKRRPLSLQPETRANGTVRLAVESDITGIALSGGGARSGAVCLGVLQALDSLTEPGKPQVLDAVDYLSTVSGGGYIGTALVSRMSDPPHAFPFSSRLDAEETPETQHLRDHSNFLAPKGMRDYLTSMALMIRGLLVNAGIVMPVLLAAALLTVMLHPDRTSLTASKLPQFAKAVGLAAIALMLATAFYNSWSYRRGTLKSRAGLAGFLAFSLGVTAFVFLLSVQPRIIAGVIGSYGCAPEKDGGLSSFSPETILKWASAVLTAITVVFIPMSQKLANLVKASEGRTSRSSTVKRITSRLALLLAALILPVLLWIAYVFLSAWAIGHSPPIAPQWLADLAGYVSGPSQNDILNLYLWVFLLWTPFVFLIGPNANSLHRLYRDRLSKAFLIPVPGCSNPDERRFSELKPREGDGEYGSRAAAAPYLLCNTAINLIGSHDMNRRGRNADNFIFSPLFIGSQATGYAPSGRMEAAVGDLTLATVMATSGAAASANMGGNTIRPLTFSLSLLNVRLGYWLANPKRLERHENLRHRLLAGVGVWFFVKEALGRLKETSTNIYLTDGGHIENLGIYELLRRRARVIVAVDAEADPELLFPSFSSLQVMARIDLGVRIDLDWRTISRSANITAGQDEATLERRKGPHVGIGAIRYDDDHHGVLIYIKSSLSGDENDGVFNYRRRNPTFPHETTIDQFFSEKQFEAYRALGFHMARSFFTGKDAFAGPTDPPPEWAAHAGEALTLLNVPEQYVEAIVARIKIGA